MKSAYAQYGVGSTWATRILSKPWGFGLEDIAVPTWVWHGEKDTLAPISGARYLVAAIPNCHATVYPDDT
ncbi:MAG TPA: hypothetical protein VGP82_01130, partial [Ktedonobacterales bacterium]|nr:hypothetical protein [Ktedonobacterales bacterium]